MLGMAKKLRMNICKIFQWTSTYAHGQPAKIYMHHFCMDTGISFDDLPGVMDDRDGWKERERVSTSSMTWWWWWWWWLWIYIIIKWSYKINSIWDFPRKDSINTLLIIIICWICKVIHISTQLWSKQSRQKNDPTWEGGLFIEHLIVHIRACHCMGCDWLLVIWAEVIL